MRVQYEIIPAALICAAMMGCSTVDNQLEMRRALVGPQGHQTMKAGGGSHPCVGKNKCKVTIVVGVLKDKSFLTSISDETFNTYKDFCYVYMPYEEIRFDPREPNDTENIELEWTFTTAPGSNSIRESDYEFCSARSGAACAGSGIEFVEPQPGGPKCSHLNTGQSASFVNEDWGDGGGNRRKFKWDNKRSISRASYCHVANVAPRRGASPFPKLMPNGTCVRFDPLIFNQ